MSNVFSIVRLILIILGIGLVQACFMKGQITTPNSSKNVGIAFSGALSATNISGTAIQLDWTLSSDPAVTEYNIYSVNSDSSLTLLGTTTPTTNLYVHSDLNSGQLYRYVVRAVASSGAVDSNLNIVTAMPYAGLVSTSVVDGTTANLYFSAASDASNLKIYCAVGASTTMTLFVTNSALVANYQLTGLTASTLYTCKVKAVLPDGSEDANTATSSFTPQASSSSPLGFAGISNATNTDDTSALIQWAAATPDVGTTLSGYRVFQMNPDFSMTFTDVAANLTSTTISSLTPGNDYTFFVRAINAADSSTDGNNVTKTIFTYAGITSASPTSATSATLNFPAATNASSLHVYCYESSGVQPTTPTASISSALTSYNISTLVTATNYTCLVKAVGTNGEDNNTATATFTTP